MKSGEGRNQEVINMAHALAASRQMCCSDDLDLLVDVIEGFGDKPTVVQLGAGSGTMGLAILGSRPDVSLWTFDNDAAMLGWEAKALENAQVELHMPGGHEIARYHPKIGESAMMGITWSRDFEFELLVVDADHSYLGVMHDLGTWGDLPELVFLHDYDGTTAPEQYPGVRQAAEKVWHGEEPLHKRGWSAVFRNPWRLE